MSGGVRVRTYAEVVPLRSVRKRRASLEKRHFARPEAGHFAGRPLQSFAAALALKRAAVKLFASLAPGRTFHESDFVFGHDAAGRPLLVRFPAVRRPPRWYLKTHVRVSASHTSASAYGAIMFEEQVHA
jgi:phosphopantetheinyl transferase (holo-ACP synthase)